LVLEELLAQPKLEAAQEVIVILLVLELLKVVERKHQILILTTAHIQAMVVVMAVLVITTAMAAVAVRAVTQVMAELVAMAVAAQV
jgi:hypothetical protein